MYYGSSRSSSYGRSSTSYNLSADISLSSLSPRNPSIQRVLNSDYGSRDRSLSPSKDYSPSRALSSPSFRRRDYSETERACSTSFSNDLDYSIKPRSYYDFPSTSSTMFTSYSSPIKKPKRIDYSDYFRPVLSTRPMLKSGYSPRSRRERESVSTPLTRERKLIKFREVSDEVLEKIRRKISWDLPEEISSPLIDEMKQKYKEPADDSFPPEQSSSRRGSKDSGTTPISGSPKLSLSRRSSEDQTQDKPAKPPMRKNSRSNSLITSSIEKYFDLKQDHSKIPIPPPRKKSLTSSTKGKNSRKSSVDILLSEEKTQNYSKIAEDIRRSREIAERIKKLAEESADENKLPSQEADFSEENKSSFVSKEAVVPDRSRRRRRMSIPEPDIIEEPPPEVRKRVRNRESSQSISPPAELKSKYNEAVEDEMPRVNSRMHRKSVKYKSDGLPPRRSSKCTDILSDATLQEISSKEESKSSILDKSVSGFRSEEKDSIKTVSKFSIKQKQTAENKIKQEENEMKSRTESSFEQNNISSATNKENERYLEEKFEKSKEKSHTKTGGYSLDKASKIDNFKSLDQNTNAISNTMTPKSKVSENDSQAAKKHPFNEIIEEKQPNSKNTNKVIKDELKILKEKDFSDSKAPRIENKDTERKISFDKNLNQISKNKSKDVCNNLLKETLEACSKVVDKTKKTICETTESKNIRTEEISKSQGKVPHSEIMKQDKSSGRFQNNTRINDVKKIETVDCLEESGKCAIQKEPIENCKDSKLKPNSWSPNEMEEVVIVCKLPKKSEHEIRKSIPKDQNVAVSIKNPELKVVVSQIQSANNAESNADQNIPTGADQTSKLQNCDIMTNVCKREASDVNVTHTIVLRPKASEVKSKAGKDVHLKSIPDVIKSTVNFGSKENDMSDVVKSTLPNTDKAEKSELSDKGKSSEKKHYKISNATKKNAKLATMTEKVSKDKPEFKSHENKMSTPKVDKKNKDLLDAQYHTSILDTSKDSSDALNTKKSSSELKTDHLLGKPDLIPNLSKSSPNKKSGDKNSLNLEVVTSPIANDRSEPMKAQNSAENKIPKDTTLHSNISNQQMPLKMAHQSKVEQINDIQKSKIAMKEIQKEADSATEKSGAQLASAKDANNMKTQISLSESKDLTKKMEQKNAILAVSDLETIKENTEVRNIEMKNTTSSDPNNVKPTIPVYKKSMTLPSVNTKLDEYKNSTENTILSNEAKTENVEHGSLSTGDVPTVLSEKKSVQCHQVPKSETMKSSNNNNQTNSLCIDKKSLDTLQLPKIKSDIEQQNLVESTKKSKVLETDKVDSVKLVTENSNQDRLKSFNQCDPNKNELKLFKKVKNIDDSKSEKIESVAKLNETKDLNWIKTTIENKDKSNEKRNEAVSYKQDEIKDAGKGIGRIEIDRKILPPEVLKLPPVEKTSKLVYEAKQKNTVLPQIGNKKLNTKIVSDISNSPKNETKFSNSIVDENSKLEALKSKEVDLNSNNIKQLDLNSKWDELSKISVKELKEKCAKEQQVSSVTKICAPPKTNKVKQVKIPEYKRYGLFIRPKEPPKTILESSSSETDTESSSEDETAKRTNLPNGKYPERPSNDCTPKQRSLSETSNASVSSTSSTSSTICTTVQQSWDESPKKGLKFRNYGVEDFSFLKLLGKGSFGKVLLAELKDSNMYFAIKCLKKDVVLEDDDVESTMIERRVLALGTQHPYMCKLYCTFQTKSYLYFVMEYLNGGDLMFHIQESGRFEEKRAVFYGTEIVSALKFLHKRGIVYRDIKLDNLMLDQQGHIRLVDFGMCQCRIYKEECMPSNFCGTPTYIAPEIVLGQRYNQSVDWWSFGVLLYEMLIGRSPFQGTDEDELFWSICNEEPHYPRFLSKEATHILGLLLVKTPSKRLGMPSCTAGDIKDHAFFRNIDWNKIENKEIPPVFKPAVSGPCDTSNFDSSFTLDTATLSPVDSEVLKSMDQEQFNGFSYTNPHLTG